MKLHVRHVKYDGVEALALYFKMVENKNLEKEEIQVLEDGPNML